MKSKAASEKKEISSGRLKIDGNWNTIKIIAPSQNNPLKAIAEFVENSIDAKARLRKLRYICRLFIKELVCQNFPGLPPVELLERMVELSLYTEEHLK